MKKTLLLTGLCSIFLAGSIGFYGCNDDDETTCIGGSGGNLTVVATLEHHGEPIANQPTNPLTVWVKYNTTSWANAPIGADMEIVAEAGEDHVHIQGLKCGKYYLYASGLDTTIQETVRGGIPINTTQESGELMVTIPVTE